MRIHHLNCGTFCPFAARMVNGEGSYFERGKMVCHCLLIETDDDGLVLVDSGFGTQDCKNHTRVHSSLRKVGNPAMRLEETALAQVQKLGFQPEDVRHIVLTHLDLDHAGGLSDFPGAQIHVHEKEYQAAFTRPSLIEKRRYLPQQWAHGPHWKTYSEYGDDWFGLEAVRTLEGVKAEIALVPLIGHTRGHAGIATKTSDGWLFHAGDAYFFHGQMENPPRCTSGMRFFQRMIAIDNRSRIQNLRRVQNLHREHHPQITVFSAHDPFEFDKIQTRTSNENR